MNILLTKDGDQWCALIGDNLQEGISGFGDTPSDALQALATGLEESEVNTAESEQEFKAHFLDAFPSASALFLNDAG